MLSKTTIAQPVKRSSRVLRRVKKNLIEPVDSADEVGRRMLLLRIPEREAESSRLG